MVYPELRHLLSPDLAPPMMPENPTDCAVPFQALIGPRGGEGAEAFGFTAVTPAYLRRSVGPTWGRGYLILEEFSWETMTHASGPAAGPLRATNLGRGGSGAE